MRKIERDMLSAISNGKTWKNGNTKVVVYNGMCSVFLHDNHIADIDNGVLSVNVVTLGKWPTPTTKSRLRALGANVYTKNHVTYLDGEAV